jgi:CMP/dCMP kinase
MVIAIDGPAGAGKSSVSQRLADRLGFTRLDTGALYRAIGLSALRAKVEPEEGPELKSLLSTLNIDQREGLVFINDVKEGLSLRRPEVSLAASAFAALPSVREKLLDLQREIASRRDCIVDGRDIGTVVFPDAPLKIYLTASARARAERRLLELQAQGLSQPLEEVQSEIERRDAQDSQREIAPLKCADDAVVVDATSMTLGEVVEVCYQLSLKAH